MPFTEDTLEFLVRNKLMDSREWFHEVDVSKYIAYFIAAINHDMSVSAIIDPHEKIRQLLLKRGYRAQ